MTRLSGLWRLAALSVGLLALGAVLSAHAVEVHLADDTQLDADNDGQLDPNLPALIGHLPVLFVHGHNPGNEANSPNYRNNWQLPSNGLQSFKDALDDNNGLGIEPYYIRFLDQDRSIDVDATEIGEAIELILRRHDDNYPAQPTHVQVVIIAYSKGTISARQYLKGLPSPGPSEIPKVSEFIAISPPNHGLSGFFPGAINSTSQQQLLNGYDGVACAPIFPAATRDYIQILNGHDIHDTEVLDSSDVYPSEAQGSRADLNANGAPNPPTNGTLYITIFADGNRDLVGGDTVPASNDCQGRRLAKNLSADAVNIPLASITGNIATSVHQNTVHTAEVMCLALFAATHHRSPVGQTCSLVGGVPVIPPPARAAAMLTLDFSGSMSALACNGCATRAAVLTDAVELFVQLWSTVSVPSDRIGVTYFSTNVTPTPIAGEALPLLSAGANDLILSVNGQVPGNATAMGGALQRAIEALQNPAVDAQIKRVILFTDGMQNVNPMVVPVGGHHEIINQAGHPNSNVTPTGVRLDQLGGIAVDTIGIGAGPDFVGLLSDIANETGGRSWLTTAPDDDLRLFFIEQLINGLRGFSPQLVAYRRGSIVSPGSTEAFAIEDGARRLVLKVSWKRGNSIDFSVARNGVDVTAAGRFISGAFYKIFVIDLPARGTRPITARGNWQVRIRGKASTAYEAAAIVDGGRITYDARFDVKRPRVGDALDLIVRSTVDGKPIGGGAKVAVTLMRPTISIRDIIGTKRPKDLPVFEPGLTIAERQLLALPQDPKKWAMLKPRRQIVELKPTGKGAFRTRFRPQVPGIYTAFVTIEGNAAKLGQFSRTVTATAVVRARKP